MKKAIALLTMLVMVLALALGCAPAAVPAPTEAPAEEPAATEAPAVEDAAEPAAEPAAQAITVTDQAGNTVTLDAPAQRIVTCSFVQTYAMMALGLSDRLVGIEAKANVRPIYALAAPQLIDLPDVGSQKEFNVEAAIALEPDVVLLPKKLLDYKETIEAVGIPCVVLYPETQAALEEQMTIIAAVCGAPEKAEALNAYYATAFGKLQSLTAAIPAESKLSVYMAGNSAYLQTAPKEMYQATLIENAGCENAAKDVDGNYWVDVSYEQLLAMNPDIIVLPCEATYTVDDVLADVNLADVAAVKNKAVYAMPSAFEAWDSCVPSGILGSLWMLATTHPEVYSMDDMRADAVEFYETFYGFTADTAEIN